MPEPKITRRVVTPAELEDLYRGSTRVAPGFWIDRFGDLHVSIVELLDLVGLEDTVENREEAIRSVRAMMGDNGADTIVVTDLAPIAPPARGVH